MRSQEGEDLMADLDADDLLQGKEDAEEGDDSTAYDIIRDPDYIPDPDMNPDVEDWIRMQREEAGACGQRCRSLACMQAGSACVMMPAAIVTTADVGAGSAAQEVL